MRWSVDGNECSLSGISPVFWVWLLQLPQYVTSEDGLGYLRPPVDDGPARQDWEDFVRPDLLEAQRHALSVVEKDLRRHHQDDEKAHTLLIADADIDSWLQVLGRARLCLEQRYRLSETWQDHESSVAEEDDILDVQLHERFAARARSALYQFLAECLVSRQAELWFEDEDDALGLAELPSDSEEDEEPGDEAEFDWGVDPADWPEGDEDEDEDKD